MESRIGLRGVIGFKKKFIKLQTRKEWHPMDFVMWQKDYEQDSSAKIPKDSKAGSLTLYGWRCIFVTGENLD